MKASLILMYSDTLNTFGANIFITLNRTINQKVREGKKAIFRKTTFKLLTGFMLLPFGTETLNKIIVYIAYM